MKASHTEFIKDKVWRPTTQCGCVWQYHDQSSWLLRYNNYKPVMILSDPINPGNTWYTTDIINYLFLSSCQTADVMWETQSTGWKIYLGVNNFPKMVTFGQRIRFQAKCWRQMNFHTNWKLWGRVGAVRSSHIFHEVKYLLCKSGQLRTVLWYFKWTVALK